MGRHKAAMLYLMAYIVIESDQKASVSPQSCAFIGYATVFMLPVPPSSTENRITNHLQPRSSLSSYLFSALRPGLHNSKKTDLSTVSGQRELVRVDARTELCVVSELLR